MRAGTAGSASSAAGAGARHAAGLQEGVWVRHVADTVQDKIGDCGNEDQQAENEHRKGGAGRVVVAEGTEAVQGKASMRQSKGEVYQLSPNALQQEQAFAHVASRVEGEPDVNEAVRCSATSLCDGGAQQVEPSASRTEPMPEPW